jgi:4-amino-4-deoxy-L-arabinose transferase-like glycosyltransferase
MHAEIAREMVTRGDWSSAYVNGVAVRSSSRALDWSIASSFKLFGVADWSARLPIALCALALAMIAFFFARKLFVWNAAGLYAALAVLVWPGTFLATRDLTAAPFLCLETTAVAFVLWHLLAAKKLGGGAALAVSAMAVALLLLAGSWPAALVAVAIAAAAWAAQRAQDSDKLAQWPLAAWAASAFALGGFLEAHPRNPWFWIGPVPPLALLAGGWLADQEAFSDKAKLRRVSYAIFAIGILVAAIAIFFAMHGPASFTLWRTSFVVTAGSTRIPLLIFAAALLAGATGNLLFRLRAKARVANCFLAGMLGGVTVAIQAGLVIASPAFSSQILADAIRPELEPTDIVAIDGKYPEASSFAFYLERPVSIGLPHAASLPAPPRGAVAVERIWAGPARVYLWTRTDHPFPVPGPSYVVAASGGKEILSNQPNSGGASF